MRHTPQKTGQQWINFLFHWPVFPILSLLLHLKSSEFPKITFRLPRSRGRGPEAKKVRPQAVFRWESGRHSYESLCQFLTEVPLSSPPSWNFFPWHLWQKYTHLSYTQLHGGWASHTSYSASNWTSAQSNGKEMCKTMLSVLALPQGELGRTSVNGSTAHDKGESSSIKKIKVLLSLWRVTSCFQESSNAHSPDLTKTQSIPQAQLHGRHKNLLPTFCGGRGVRSWGRCGMHFFLFISAKKIMLSTHTLRHIHTRPSSRKFFFSVTTGPQIQPPPGWETMPINRSGMSTHYIRLLCCLTNWVGRGRGSRYSWGICLS